jgi:hypothetical protein
VFSSRCKGATRCCKATCSMPPTAV